MNDNNYILDLEVAAVLLEEEIKFWKLTTFVLLFAMLGFAIIFKITH